METKGPEGALSTHALKAGQEFDLGDGEAVSEVERSVHVLWFGTWVSGGVYRCDARKKGGDRVRLTG